MHKERSGGGAAPRGRPAAEGKLSLTPKVPLTRTCSSLWLLAWREGCEFSAVDGKRGSSGSGLCDLLGGESILLAVSSAAGSRLQVEFRLFPDSLRSTDNAVVTPKGLAGDADWSGKLLVLNSMGSAFLA